MQKVDCDLNSCFLCSSVIPEWKAVIALKKSTFLVKKGRPVFKEGDEVKGIFFINAGSVKVHKQWTQDKELIIRFARSGDIVGHRALGDKHYPISVTAIEDSKLCFIPNDILEATFKTNADFTYRMMHFYATELQKAEKRMRNLAHMEVKGRIADALLQIAELYGNDTEGFIAANLTRQDISSYAGTTYETVFKFFNELTSAGIIDTSGKNIRISKPLELRNFISNNF
jgi:CRP-like cAMP-binding protein